MYVVYTREGTGSMVVEAILEEASAPYETVQVKRDANKQPPADFFSVNPLGQVPALKLPDGSVMTESAAIAIYLADKHAAAQLAPTPASPLRAPWLRWIIFFATNVYTSDLRIYYADRYTIDAHGAAAVKASALMTMAKEWEIYAAALGDKQYTLGDRFSAVDIYAAMLATWNSDVPAFFVKHPNIKSLYDRVVARPAVARVWRRHNL